MRMAGRWGFGTGRALLLIVALAMSAFGCGSNVHRTATGTPPESSATVSSPSVVVSPNRDLVGGEHMQVTVRGFPVGATLGVFECASTDALSACSSSSAVTLYSGTTGSATGAFVAQPVAATSSNQSLTPCRDQCVLVAMVVKRGGGVPASPPPTATAALSFRADTSPGLQDSALVGLSWDGPTTGWALAQQPCLSGLCVEVAQTSDGGTSWQSLPSPKAWIQDGSVDCSQVPCVTRVLLVDSRVGYLYGPGLLMSVDGGQTWKVQPGLQVEALAVTNAMVFRVAYQHDGCPGPCSPVLQEASVGSASWRTVVPSLAYPDRSTSAQIVASGSSLLTALYGSQAGPLPATATVYRSTDGGSTWRQQPDPCSGRGSAATGEDDDLIALTAAPGGFFAGLCAPHIGTGSFVGTSTDSGASWQTAGDLPAEPVLTQIAAASPEVLDVSTGTVGGGGAFTARVVTSTDSGRHWVTTATDAQQLSMQGLPPSGLGFESSQVGWWIGDPHTIWITRDGGAHWTPVPFG
jgi:photosystem II stability/assembly factor-like uncharacterized protein